MLAGVALLQLRFIAGQSPESSAPAHAKSRRDDKGYYLHARRLQKTSQHAEAKAIKTLKYPLIGHDDPGWALEGALADAVRHDERWLFGYRNFQDLTDHRHHCGDEREYSMLGFWVQALAVGCFFGVDSQMANHFGNLVGAAKLTDRAFEQVDPEIKGLINRNKWDGYMATGTYRKSATRGFSEVSIRKGIAECFIKDAELPSRFIARLDTFVADVLGGKVDESSLDDARRQLFGIPADVPLRRGKAQATNKGRSMRCAIVPNFAADEHAARLMLEGPTDFFDHFLAEVQPQRTETEAHKKEAAAKERWKDAWPGTIGIGINGNSFTGLIDLFESLNPEGGVEDTLALWMERFPYTPDDQEVLLERLTCLREYAVNLPGEPLLVSNWREYRTTFSGLLESWLSNRSVKIKQSAQDIARVKKNASKIVELLAPHLDSPLVTALSDAAKLLAGGDCSEVGATRAETDLIERQQGAARTAYNDFRQQDKEAFRSTLAHLDEEGGDKQHPAVSEALKRVQSAPMFFGEGARQAAHSDWMWRERAANFLHQVIGVYDASAEAAAAYELSDRQVAALASVAGQAEDSFVLGALAAAAQRLGCDFADQNDRASFFVSPYARQKKQKLAFQPITWGDLLIGEQLRSALISLHEDITGNQIVTSDRMRDLVSLAKVLVSAVAQNAGRSAEERAALDYAFAELHGIVARISKTSALARNVIQGKHTLLHRHDIRVSKSGAFLGAKYFYSFPHLKTDLNNVFPDDADEWDGAAWAKKKARRGARQPVGHLAVTSSKTQIAHLDSLSWTPTQRAHHVRKGVSLTAAGRALYVEHDTRIDWSGPHPTIVRLVNEATNEDPSNVMASRRVRVGVAQPFTWQASKQASSDLTVDQPQRFMGVDIGEYVMTWAVVEPRDFVNGMPTKFVTIATGTITEPGHRKLAGQVNRKRGEQARLTFGSTDTYLARLRKHLTTSYRARLHAVSLRYGAQLVFEHEVDSFETGGNLVKRLYSSIKAADASPLQGDNEAARALRTGAWGVAKTTAVSVTASYSSQTCSQCKRSFSTAFNPHADERHFGQVYGYQNGQAALAKFVVDADTAALSKDDKADLRRSVKAAMRPVIGGLAMPNGAVPSDFNWQAWRHQRGNSAVFVCPYLDCRHVADADIQAAVTVAVRGGLVAADKANGQKSVKTLAQLTKQREREAKSIPPVAAKDPGTQADKLSYTVAWFTAELDRIGLEGYQPVGLES